jgi:hypothetical protein
MTTSKRRHNFDSACDSSSFAWFGHYHVPGYPSFLRMIAFPTSYVRKCANAFHETPHQLNRFWLRQETLYEKQESVPTTSGNSGKPARPLVVDSLSENAHTRRFHNQRRFLCLIIVQPFNLLLRISSGERGC